MTRTSDVSSTACHAANDVPVNPCTVWPSPTREALTASNSPPSRAGVVSMKEELPKTATLAASAGRTDPQITTTATSNIALRMDDLAEPRRREEPFCILG